MTRRHLIRYAIGLTIAAACIWYLFREIDSAALTRALAAARPLPVAFAAFAFALTTVAKAARWHLLFPDSHRLHLSNLWRVLMIGQVINMLSPIPRLGDISRIVQLHRSNHISRAEVLGTLVSEKSFDLIFTAILMALLLPLVTVPQLITNPFTSIALITALMIVALYLLAFQAGWVLAIFGRMTTLLPTAIGARCNTHAESILRGFSSLSDPSNAMKLLLVNLMILLLAVSSPLFILYAVGMEVSWVTAILIYIAVSLGLSVPGVPARIGIFEGIVFATFIALGVNDEAQILAYGVLLHLIIIVPTLIFGALVAITTPGSISSLYRYPTTI